MTSDGELLARVLKTKDFFQSVILSDDLDDWNLARELGEFLVRIEPDSEIMGHALLARAYRHLGNRGRALDELKQCQVRVANRELKPWEAQLFLPLLAEEEKLLSSGKPEEPEPHKT
jgi:hypothetical protein